MFPPRAPAQLPVGNNPPTTQPLANADDYEYLCADGSRRPVNGGTAQPPCSWAQRPWQAYMANADVRPRAAPLQQQIADLYELGKRRAAAGGEAERDRAARLLIDERNVVAAKAEHSLPGEHLDAANYRDVIERNADAQRPLRLCVRRAVEQRKCEVLSRVAFARDIRPQFECVLAADCTAAVRDGRADATVEQPADWAAVRAAGGLVPLVQEELDGGDAYVAVVARGAFGGDAGVELQKAPM